MDLDGNLDVLEKGDVWVEHEGDVVAGDPPLPVWVFPLWGICFLGPAQRGVDQALSLLFSLNNLDFNRFQ